MTNTHNFSLITGKCSFQPEIIVNEPKMFFEQSKEFYVEINQRSVNIGRITPSRDEHGNKRLYATSAILPDEEMMFYDEGKKDLKASGAYFWLWCISQVHAKA